MDELALFNKLREEFDKFHASLLGISVDGSGVTSPLPETGVIILHSSPISNPREKFPASMASTGSKTA
jgi:hypothetical protein